MAPFKDLLEKCLDLFKSKHEDEKDWDDTSYVEYKFLSDIIEKLKV